MYSIEKTQEALIKWRLEKKTIVLCFGLFHFIHIGHIKYLKQAKAFGDVLLVAVRADKFIRKEEDVQFEEGVRVECIMSLNFIDAVFISPYEDVYDLIDLIRPDIFVEGTESNTDEKTIKQHLDFEKGKLEKIGVKFAICKENEFFSTFEINQYLARIPEDLRDYMRLFKIRNPESSVIDILEDLGKLNALVIGDTILDDYHYCSAIGKSSKDPTLALKYESSDLFAGGAIAVANHVAGYARQVTLLTVIGENDNYEKFIRSKLKDNIKPLFLVKTGAPTLIKRRFIDGNTMSKLLEIYIMDDTELNTYLEDKFKKMILSELLNCDLVISADFGHGTISQEMKELLAQKSPFLCVNTQSNAGNRGFNNITKYPKADFISMAEHEIRLEMRDLRGQVRPMMASLVQKMQASKIIVTRGLKGSMVMDNKSGFVQIPAFGAKVVDRIGAGDALFSLTSLAAAHGATNEILGFLGNIVGTLAVEIMGNQSSIDAKSVSVYIKKLYKTFGG